MALRDEVLGVLNALCEGTGVSVAENGDIEVQLGEVPLSVRVFGEPDHQPAVYVYAALADEVPLSPPLSEFLHDTSKEYCVFRVFWEDDSIFLRADLAATPFVPAQLQRIVEDFEKVAVELAPQAQEWSVS